MNDRYRESFREEAREILLDLETALLELNERCGDGELIGRAFRALHTIKGTGAMFGFEEVAAFTHNLETAFDRVRNGKLEASPDLISLSLAGVDHIRALLEEAAGGKKANAAAGEDILASLRALTGESEAHPFQQAIPPDTSSPRPSGPKSGLPGTPISPVTDAASTWHLRFRPGSDILRDGTNPFLLFRELRQLGSLQIKADTSAVPPLRELDPERCHLAWEMTLTTAVSADAIRDVFIFVEDNCELVIEAAAAGPAPAGAGGESLAPAVPEKRAGEGPLTADKNNKASSIRVSAAKLDQLVDLVGQLVTVHARLGEIAARSEDRDMQAVAEEIENLTANLRANSMSVRTTPVGSIFERLKRLVYDLGRSLHKQVELTVEGGETELDKTVIEQLNDPLMHLIRNSMDHGIEPPEARRAAGKPATANIHLSARHAGAQVLICVSDDGRGIDAEAVRARAIEKGLIGADARLSESEVFSLILEPGFSTAREVTDVSGRGVGMDVVRRNVESLRGSIQIASRPGAGSTVTLRLPLTLAIIDGLLVRIGQSRFVMPLTNTVECVELTRQDIEEAGGKHLATIRGEIIPYIRLREFLHIHTGRPEREHVMVAETEHGRFGFVVDQVLGDHQTVIKNLGRLYRNVQFASGATILGDGSVALILDLHRLAQEVIRTTALDSAQALPSSRAAQRGLQAKAAMAQ
jgi:two-component system chemotaxis sensor kinase CheA